MSIAERPADLAPAPSWWKRRSLKLRLAACFTLVASVVILGLIPFVYVLIERRLHMEMDRQLYIDWNLVEAHLEADEAGGIRWRKNSPSTPSSPGYAETWFDVWSGGDVVFSHWPTHGARILQPPAPVSNQPDTIYNLALQQEMTARTLQKPSRIDGREVTLRVFRDESGIRSTLREILIGLGLGLPFAVLLAALGGYLMAGRALRPLRAMAEQARQITSESLSRRLPNPNPNDELGQLATVFNETLKRLESSFESLKRFTADASHELRTPLTALHSVGEIALREGGDAKALRETVASMLEEAQRLNDLIDTLLMFARVETGRANLRLETFPLDELVAETCENLEVLGAEKGQRIDLRAGSAAMVEADRMLLRHAIMNILHNAIRYSPEGSTVRVECFRRGEQALVEIADQGPGIAPEHRARVFERFYRIEKARSRAEGGAGLGLAIARLFVEQFGGSLGLSSEPGAGSCFRIELPIRPSGPAAIEPPSAARSMAET
jgi:heavy metal sensor kinase